MIEKINEQVDCITIYKKLGGIVMPYKIKWNGRSYLIKKLGYHYKTRVGRIIQHYFSVSTDTLAFKLRFDPENMQWILEEVSDGSSN